MKTWLAGAVVGLCTYTCTMANSLTPRMAQAAPIPHTQWSNRTALTIAPRRLELGLLSESSYGHSERVEVRLHPLAFFAFPHAEIKLRWPTTTSWQFSTLHRVTYPTPFLSTVSRSDTGGLLPSTDDTPHALLVDNDLLASLPWGGEHWLTIRAGFSVATPGSDRGTLLDFPFLFPRLAALHAPWVPRVALSSTGSFSPHFGYEAELQSYHIPLADYPSLRAHELQTSLFFRPNASHQLSIHARVSKAKYPIGWRTHLLPHVDYRIVW